jgi:formylglycine-generating enzyme required for sulfatase activity
MGGRDDCSGFNPGTITDAMMRPHLLVSLGDTKRQNERDGNPFLLRDTILQSETTLRITGWNKGNLLRSIDHRSNRTFSVYVFGVVSAQNGDLLIRLGTPEILTLQEALKTEKVRNSNLSVFVLYCDAEAFDSVRGFVTSYPSSNALFIVCSDDLHYFFFALACELTHWWGIESCLFENVSFEHIGKCAQAIANAYSGIRIPSSCRVAVVCKPRTDDSTAWTGGLNYAGAIDIQKLRQGARTEEFQDTLKRIVEAAKHSREQHSPSFDRMVSSQGLFWLAEASPIDQMATYLRDTRLFRECHPYMTELPPAVRFRALEHPNVSFFCCFQAHFVSVPAGIYPFGSTDDSIESEPPAPLTNLCVPGFSIMRALVTYRFIRHFVQCDTPLEMDEIPVTNVSFFDAEYIAEACTAALHRYGPESSSSHMVRLPTEYQWEAAARGMSVYNYPWGDIFDERFANSGMRIGHPTPPGMFSPQGDSVFGCRDMAGNVKEWTRSYGGTRGIDWSVHSQSRVQGDDRKIVDSSRLIVRGGSYSYPPECVQSWVRNTQIASRRDAQTGFRLVVEGMHG